MLKNSPASLKSMIMEYYFGLNILLTIGRLLYQKNVLAGLYARIDGKIDTIQFHNALQEVLIVSTIPF